MRWLRWVRSLLLAMAAVVAVLVAAALDFARRTQSTYVPSRGPLPGVVFTGQFNRVHAGLALMEVGAITPLLISGANPGTGITVAGFANQFQLSPALRTALATGRLVLGPGANNTFENAQEARQWLVSQFPGQTVVLITSRFHMPRASLALEQALGDRVVVRFCVKEDTVQFSGVTREFAKYLYTAAQAGLAKLT